MEKVIFKVFRFNPERDKKPRFDKYEVPIRNGMTVLDALYYIQGYLDGSLAFRSSCREGVCGSCGMHINGKYRLACETQINRLKSKKITIKPLGHLPVIKDLVVDMTDFWEKYSYIKPYLIAGAPPEENERIQTQDDRNKLDGLIDCILCACCYAACTITDTEKNYLGPAALLKVDRFVEDSRDNNKKERLLTVSGDSGIFRCHTLFNCQEVCPKNLDPTGAIARLKRMAISNTLCFWEK
ncbi:succinate dehydrogenase iron-sulfur subunit [candidate division KSB1 bacterium]|nr:MAG: succinate dehydrogenase iron-sulfur subunit [candidate division KSB1 bacterium]